MKNESQTEFTSGPWMIANGDTLYSNDGGFVEIAVFRNDDDWEVEQRANKSLVAQAPAMYTAMQEFCDRVDRGEVRSRKTYEQFKSILAAARGEQV